MWSSDIKPNCFLHVSKSRNSTVYYVVDIFLSSSVVERHIFSNKRKCDSFVCHCSYVMPSYNQFNSCLSYQLFPIFAEQIDDFVSFNR